MQFKLSQNQLQAALVRQRRPSLVLVVLLLFVCSLFASLHHVSSSQFGSWSGSFASEASDALNIGLGSVAGQTQDTDSAPNSKESRHQHGACLVCATYHSQSSPPLTLVVNVTFEVAFNLSHLASEEIADSFDFLTSRPSRAPPFDS